MAARKKDGDNVKSEASKKESKSEPSPPAPPPAPRQLRRTTRNHPPPSPGRRCEPHHHEAAPGPPALKVAGKVAAVKPAVRCGFYSAVELQRYLRKDERILRRRRSSRKSTRSRKVGWSKQLEW